MKTDTIPKNTLLFIVILFLQACSTHGPLAKLMEKMINQYHQVLIVYGSGHLVQERPMLQKIFKSYENLKWF